MKTGIVKEPGFQDARRINTIDDLAKAPLVVQGSPDCLVAGLGREIPRPATRPNAQGKFLGPGLSQWLPMLY